LIFFLFFSRSHQWCISAAAAATAATAAPDEHAAGQSAHATVQSTQIAAGNEAARCVFVSA
jgi:hypothetical protein